MYNIFCIRNKNVYMFLNILMVFIAKCGNKQLVRTFVSAIISNKEHPKTLRYKFQDEAT